ncbi:hypothetical protein [Micromonospora carbonacea]|uniref:hypothetical protein n=1 Tax=Micromonospora carbonacea TaxID=47853 RepID=UPI0037197FD2
MAAYTTERRRETVAQAREVLNQTLAEQVDPDGVLAATDPAKLAQLVTEARRARISEGVQRYHARRRARLEALEAATIAAEAVLRAAARVDAA